MNFREYGLHDEVKREMEEKDGEVFVYESLDNSVNPSKFEWKVYRRDDRWMVKFHGNWCEITGWKLDLEHPRIVSFRIDFCEKY